MKRYSKIIILAMIIVVFGFITILHYKNKLINNQPEKSNLVKDIERGQYNEEYRW